MDKVTIVGTVDTNTAGVYTVKYTIGSISKTATITVDPKPDLSEIQVKDSTIKARSPWTAEDNFISAKNEDGETVGLDEVTVTGDVYSDLIGTYTITYTIGTKSKTATITVEAATFLGVKDTIIPFGSDWSPENNYAGAIDENGFKHDISAVEVIGTVDTNTAGTYTVTYKFRGLTKVATIVVQPKGDLSSIRVKDTTLGLGADWEPILNFISATDVDGNKVNIESVTVTESVDTSTPGVYQVTYAIGTASKTATITVTSEPAHKPNIDAIQNKIVSLVNELRLEVGQPALTQNTDLTIGAVIRSKESILVFDHVRPDGTPWDTIADEINYPNLAGENLTKNLYWSESDDIIAEKLFTQWKNLPEHYSNMVHPAMNEIGVGVTIYNNQVFAAQLFGVR